MANKVMGSLGKKENHPVDLDLVFSSLFNYQFILKGFF
jgi:hypothetical protein